MVTTDLKDADTTHLKKQCEKIKINHQETRQRMTVKTNLQDEMQQKNPSSHKNSAKQQDRAIIYSIG